MNTRKIRAVIFDFGGVLAEEGFRQGLLTIGRKNGQNRERFRRLADDLIHETGYVTGHVDERAYWDTLRRKTGIRGSDDDLRGEILSRFILRPEMLDLARALRQQGYLTAVLSDQTNWLEEIDAKRPFLSGFCRVFNSYRTRKSKRDPSAFDDACAALGVQPSEALFIDDNPDNIRMAGERGLMTILFRDEESCRRSVEAFVGPLQLTHT